MRLLFLAISLLASSTAIASDMSGIVYLIGAQFIYLIWPLLLPLPFLVGLSAKFRAYFIYLVAVYGVEGLVGLPVNVISGIAVWHPSPEILVHWIAMYTVVRVVLTFAIAVWLLVRVRRHLDELPRYSNKVRQGERISPKVA